MRTPRRPRAMLLAATGSLALALGAQAAAPPPPPVPPSRPPEPLAGKLPPAPPAADYGRLVADKRWLVALGKALFWDEGVGSDGDQACASCHFHAGADPRTTNQLSPGLNVRPQPDGTFGDPVNHLTGGGNQAGPNYALKPADFPFHRLAGPDRPQVPVAYDTDDVASSAGVFEGGFLFPTATVRFRGRRVDQCSQALSDIFHLGAGGKDVNTRKVEPRNTPTVVNAAFNYRNFWDGRANNIFNGVDPFGRRSSAPTRRRRSWSCGAPRRRRRRSSCRTCSARLAGGRAAAQRLRDVVRRAELRRHRPPAAAEDRARLAGPEGRARRQRARRRRAGRPAAAPTGVGLAYTYGELVRKAFQKDLWRRAASGGSTRTARSRARRTRPRATRQIELNFSLFFGLAIEPTSARSSPTSPPSTRATLSADEQAGLALFQDRKANCVACHDGPLFSKARAPSRATRRSTDRSSAW